MDKINLKYKRKHNHLNADKESLLKNKSTLNIKNQTQKDGFSQPLIQTLNKYFENVQSLIKKNISQDSNHSFIKQINNSLLKIMDILKDLDSQINQYQKNIIYYEAKIRNLQGTLFSELLNKEIFQNNITSLLQKEKDYELIKEKTGIIVNNGKIINTNRKDNEIIILRTENSTLKGVIEQYEIKMAQKEEEYNKKIINFIKEKNELTLKVNQLKKEMKKMQNNNYSRYNIAKKKLNLNNKKSYEFSRTNNESNDLFNNNPSTINILQANDNNNYIDNLNKYNFGDIKMNTIAATHMHTINHSHKSGTCNAKIKDKFKKFINENNNLINIKEEEKSNDNNLINKTFHQNPKNKSNKKRNIDKTLNNHIYNKIILNENIKNKLKNKIIKTDRTKTKCHEHHLNNNDSINKHKNNKNLNTYFRSNKQIRKIIHKKTNSNKVNCIPFNCNNLYDKREYNISNKENNKNENNLVNIKNLILNKGQKIKKNKINIIYRNLLPNSMSNSNSNNNSRNINARNNISKLHTFNTSKVPTPKSFANN